MQRKLNRKVFTIWYWLLTWCSSVSSVNYYSSVKRCQKTYTRVSVKLRLHLFARLLRKFILFWKTFFEHIHNFAIEFHFIYVSYKRLFGRQIAFFFTRLKNPRKQEITFIVSLLETFYTLLICCCIQWYVVMFSPWYLLRSKLKKYCDIRGRENMTTFHWIQQQTNRV